MISRADFTFTIGYEGNIAVVDGALKKRYASLSTLELAEAGLYKQALCSVIYALEQEDPEQLEKILAIYNENSQVQLASAEELKRTFGVFEVPAGIGKVTVI
ncbi:hypothetical protein ES703_97589 [subsurface metagenome]